MKKQGTSIRSLLLTVFLVLVCNPVTAFGIVKVEVNGICYGIDGWHGTAVVMSHPIGYSGDIVIPSSIEHNGKPYTVVGIGPRAFCNCTELFSIHLPDTTQGIGTEAFRACFGLSVITIPDTVQIIGDGAFFGCIGLRRVFFSPNSQLIHIGSRCFHHCVGLGRLCLPDGLQTMGMDVFGKGESIPELDIFLASIGGLELEDEVFCSPEEASDSHASSQAAGSTDTHESAQAAGVSEAPASDDAPCCSCFYRLYNFFCSRS